jgi:hypothetical protein
VNENHFLPKRVVAKPRIKKPADKKKQTPALQTQLSMLISSMAGFG